MVIPRVAIVGRPNVGKSSLFNWLVGKRISIVEPTAGVTRDRVAAIVEVADRSFELVDTGGVGIVDRDDLSADVERQIETALQEADVIVFVVDVRAGLVPLDEHVAERLRTLGKPIVLAVNKCDYDGLESEATEFHRLALDPLTCVSAQNNRNKKELLSRILAVLPQEADVSPPEPAMKLAIVGRRNVGKSTFINALAQEERMIVSEIPGTTRDSVDVRFERDGKVFIAIDTAGVRKRKSIKESIEFYSLARAEKSIRRADVVLLFHDAMQPVGKVDKQLAEFILKHHKPAVFVVNKWDLAKSQTTTGEYAEYLQAVYSGLHFVPFAFITAKRGKNVHKVLNLAQHLFKQASTRVATGDLNRIVRDAIDRNPPPVRHGRRPKVYYATQVAVRPPTIVLFTNGPHLFDPPYERYLHNFLHRELPFAEVPIRLILRDRKGEDGASESLGEPVVESQARRKKTPHSPNRELWDV